MTSRRGEAWREVVQLVAEVEAELGKVLQARHGLGLTEFRALELLARAPDSELRMQELATQLRLNQSSVSRMVERLERGGLTVRDLCPDDRRGVYTVLTERGRARLEGARPDYARALEMALEAHGGGKLLAARAAKGR